MSYVESNFEGWFLLLYFLKIRLEKLPLISFGDVEIRPQNLSTEGWIMVLLSLMLPLGWFS